MASSYDLKSGIISGMYSLEGRGAGVYTDQYLAKSIRNNTLLRMSLGNVLTFLKMH